MRHCSHQQRRALTSLQVGRAAQLFEPGHGLALQAPSGPGAVSTSPAIGPTLKAVPDTGSCQHDRRALQPERPHSSRALSSCPVLRPCRVVVPDLPAHGSRFSETPLTLHNAVDTLRGVIQKEAAGKKVGGWFACCQQQPQQQLAAQQCPAKRRSHRMERRCTSMISLSLLLHCCSTTSSACLHNQA